MVGSRRARALRRTAAIAAIVSLFPLADLVTSASAATPEQRAQLQKSRGQVAVKLTSGQTVKGQVREMGAEGFVLLVGRAKTPAEIAYSQVSQVGSDTGKSKKILLGVAFGAALAIITVMGVKKAHRWPDGTVIPGGGV